MKNFILISSLCLTSIYFSACSSAEIKTKRETASDTSISNLCGKNYSCIVTLWKSGIHSEKAAEDTFIAKFESQSMFGSSCMADVSFESQKIPTLNSLSATQSISSNGPANTIHIQSNLQFTESSISRSSMDVYVALDQELQSSFDLEDGSLKVNGGNVSEVSLSCKVTN